MLLYWFQHALWLTQALHKHIINLLWWKGSGGTSLKKNKNYEAKFKNINALSQNMTEYFTLQPEFHLSQRWRSPYLRSQWGADHWASSFAHAPDIASTATSAPAQSHVPGLLCVSLGHGRGELSGSRENCWARARDSPAPCHGMLPKLSSSLPGKVSFHYVLLESKTLLLLILTK